MYPPERHQAILTRARANGRIDVAAAADELGVTPETIRRDLTTLERQGMVRRVHGGAIPVERLGFEPAVPAREGMLMAEKERIAKRALDELPDEGAVIIDSGTTTAWLAELLPMDLELTVVTNSLPVASMLALRPHLYVHLVGGRVRGRTMAAVDEWAERALADVYVDVAFVGTNGISAGRGFTTPDRAEAGVKRAMVAAARRTVVMADHTKIGHDSFARFASPSEVDLVVTDDGADRELIDHIRSSGPEVTTA